MIRLFVSLLFSITYCSAQLIPGVISSSQRFINPAEPVLPAPDFWIDGSDVTKYTNSVEQGFASISEKGRLIDQVTSSDAAALTSTAVNSGVLQYKPSFNGEGHFFNGHNGYTFGSASTFNTLHNGTAFEMYIVIKQLPIANSTTSWSLLRTASGTANASRGIGLWYLNNSSSGAIKTVRFEILNQAGGSAPFDVTCSSNTIIDNEYNILKIVFTGSALSIYVKNSANPTYTLKGSDNTGSGLSASDAAGAMAICGAATTNWRGYLKQSIIYYRNLNGSDESAAEDWIDDEVLNVVTPQTVNLWFAWGQSNLEGTATTTIPSALNGNLGAHVFYAPNNSNTGGQGYWDQFVYGITTNPATGTPNDWGSFPRFIKEISSYSATPTYLIWRGIGSTILIPNGILSWSSVTTTGTSDLYPLYKDGFTVDGLDELVHIMRKTPVIRGLIKMQGETDAANNVTNCFMKYHDEWEAWCLNWTDWVNTLGYSTAKMRIVNPRIFGSVDPGWIAVQAAETGVMDSLLIRNPSYSSKIKASKWIDTNGLPFGSPHYTGVGYDSIGYRLFRYYRLYVNE